ncbi:MAG: serine/threonine-protein kinase, partial [Cyanobacteriota bacterium]|nr:serine/threonine-protein kinase [Cyanobacteriota bacterium]
MSYCFNPNCNHPQNSERDRICQSCGHSLRLQERYRVLKLIGQGGFGRTFLAVDESQPAKPRCAIKQFFPSPLSSDNREKAAELFRQEAQRLRELGRHSQIPKLWAYLEDETGQYLVQEYIEGCNLARELEEEGAFNEEKIRQLLETLLPVLQVIHNHGIIHRDLKPENIIRRPSNISPPSVVSPRVGEVKNNNPSAIAPSLALVDFGAAKYTTQTTLGKTGTVIGSAAYTAPEQLYGKAVFASDLYSLGLTCIHLLTLMPPFDLFDGSENRWNWRKYAKHPISPKLGRILDKMLHPATKQRYQSAREVLQDLTAPPLITKVAQSRKTWLVGGVMGGI